MTRERIFLPKIAKKVVKKLKKHLIFKKVYDIIFLVYCIFIIIIGGTHETARALYGHKTLFIYNF